MRSPVDIERTMQHAISRTLMAGMSVSGVLMAAGFALYAAQPSWHDAGVPAFDRALLAGGSMQALLNPFLYLYAGILVLMCTPVVRVCISVAGFARERDWRYVAISSVVLAVIAVSVALSVAH